jgi:integrase
MNALSTVVKTAKQENRKAKHARLSSVAATCDDSSTAKPVRVNGPYPEGDKWRIYLIDGSGRKSFFYNSRADAEAMKAKLVAKARALKERTIGESLDDYCDYRVRVRGVLPQPADHQRRHLRMLLPPDWPLASLTTERAQRLYLEYAGRQNRITGKPISVATHQWVLLLAKCWGRWLVKSGASLVNPLASVEPIGRAKAGKLQLTRDEAQCLSQVAVKKAQAGEREAIGILLMLHLGLRKGEVAARVARDVDTEGQVLIIPFGKTATSRRRLEVPVWLRPYLQSLCEGRAPTELLFLARCGTKPLGKQYWWRKIRQLCKVAAVPLVCPHSLRGLHATHALEEGASGDAVARALGHTNFKMTAKHYASADSVANARLAKASQTLAPQTAADRLGGLISQLTPAELAELRQRLISQSLLPSHTSSDHSCP